MATLSKIYLGSALLGGTSTTDLYPGPPLSELVNTAASKRDTTTVTFSGSAHTLGSWVEIDPSLSANVGSIAIDINAVANANFVDNTDSSTLMQLGVGGSGSEVVWTTFNVGYWSIAGYPLVIPGYVPAGSRLSYRIQSIRTSGTFGVVFTLLPTKSIRFGASTAYGVNLAASRGTVITEPVYLNYKGAWTEITSSTSAAMRALTISPSGASFTAGANTTLLFDIGIGASGSEQVLIGDQLLSGSSSERLRHYSPSTYGISLSAGVRLSARYARFDSGNKLDVILIGTA